MTSKKTNLNPNNKDPEAEAPGAASILSQWSGMGQPTDEIHYHTIMLKENKKEGSNFGPIYNIVNFY